MSKKNEEKSQQSNAENQAEVVQAPENAVTQTAINVQENGEQSKMATSDDDKAIQTSAKNADDQERSDPDAGKIDVSANKPKLENLSVLADRHRIPAWHQAALLRYMGWQDDKMVSDKEYQNALDELKHRRIGGGRK